MPERGKEEMSHGAMEQRTATGWGCGILSFLPAGQDETVYAGRVEPGPGERTDPRTGRDKESPDRLLLWAGGKPGEKTTHMCIHHMLTQIHIQSHPYVTHNAYAIYFLVFT